VLGIIGLDTNAYTQVPIWIAEGLPPPPPLPPGQPTQRRDSPRLEPPGSEPPHRKLYREVHLRLLTTGVTLKEEVLLQGDNYACDYFQIDVPRGGKPLLSHSMAGRQFKLDTSAFPPGMLISAIYDEPMLEPDMRVRRVVLKASSVDAAFFGGRRRPPVRRETSRAQRGRPGPTIYVHCAAELDKRDAAFAAFAQQRDDDLAKVAEETRDSLRDLRHWLWGISLAVFAATAAGTYGLVRLGLSPLRRLSYAVSQVSAKDFRLPLDGRPLPLELRPIAKRLTSTLDLLKRAFAREKQAAADISHELRTPLAALMTTTEFALRKPRSVEHYRELLSDIHASAQQMHQIVERLLTLARLDAGVDRLRLQTVDVAGLAQQCAAVIRPLAEARGLKLTVKSPQGADATPLAGGDGASERSCVSAPSACLVQADPDKLREIVTNLLHNAIQYNRPGGSVDLRVARENGTLEVEVQDTGIGIAPEAREMIFERFYRVDPSRGGDDLHAGLGLAIVKEYIDLMGGSIGVESTPGQGSTFRVLLPVR
jgi:signal transduction histidine kinase